MSATPATQNEGGCEIAPRLPRETKVDVRLKSNPWSSGPEKQILSILGQNERRRGLNISFQWRGLGGRIVEMAGHWMVVVAVEFNLA